MTMLLTNWLTAVVPKWKCHGECNCNSNCNKNNNCNSMSGAAGVTILTWMHCWDYGVEYLVRVYRIWRHMMQSSMHRFDFIKLNEPHRAGPGQAGPSRAELGNKSKTSSKFVSPPIGSVRFGLKYKEKCLATTAQLREIASYVIILLSTFDYY